MTTLYEKRGRRYYPVQDREATDGLPNGTWLVDVKDGRRACIKTVDRAEAIAKLAAVPRLTELIVSELQEWSRCRPAREPTAKEKKAWAAYCAVMGPDATLTMSRPSGWEVASRVARRLGEIAND
jgi:hypothetical protein